MLLLLTSCLLNAQGIPGTEIVLFDINEAADGPWQLSQGTNITQQHIQSNIGISKDYNVFELQKALGQKQVTKVNRIIFY